LDPEVQQLVEKRKEELEKRRKAIDEELKDLFYAKIQADRESDLVDEVVKKRKLKSVDEMKRYDLEKLQKNYQDLYDQYCADYMVSES